MRNIMSRIIFKSEEPCRGRVLLPAPAPDSGGSEGRGMKAGTEVSCWTCRHRGPREGSRFYCRSWERLFPLDCGGLLNVEPDGQIVVKLRPGEGRSLYCYDYIEREQYLKGDWQCTMKARPSS